MIIWLPLFKDEAIVLSKFYCAEIKCIKDKIINENNYGVDDAAVLFLDEIKAKILKFKITKEIMEENENEEKN